MAQKRSVLGQRNAALRQRFLGLIDASYQKYDWTIRPKDINIENQFKTIPIVDMLRSRTAKNKSFNKMDVHRTQLIWSKSGKKRKFS